MDSANTPSTAPNLRARRDALRAGCRAFVATVGLGLPLVSGAGPAAAKRVLLVHSFGRDFAPYDAVIATFRRELASRAVEPVVFLEAALDAGRAIGAAEEATFAAYLEARFANPKPDLIVGIGPPAAQFVTRLREALFPGGWIHHQGLLGGLREIASIGATELAARVLMLMVAFVPFFGFCELGRVLGMKQLAAMFFSTPGTPPAAGRERS